MRSMKGLDFTRNRHRNKSKSKYIDDNLTLLNYSLETKLFTESHTKTVLEGEREVVKKKLDVVKMENAQMARDISRNQMFNKKDEVRKEKKETMDKLKRIIREQNQEIE